MVSVRERRCVVESMTFPSSDLSDDDDDECDDLIKTGWRLYVKIYKFLDAKSLLRSRLVCRRWNHIICAENLLWSNLRVNIRNNNAHRPQLKAPGADISISPNFHFQNCDFSAEFFREFFMFRANSLKHLKVSDSIITLPNLQSIIVSCEVLEHLEIDGVSSALAFSETIFPKVFQLRRLTRLKTLILKAVELSQAESVLDAPTLHPGFLQDLIEHSVNLEVVHLIRWSGRTLNNFMNIVNQRVRYRQLVEFQATEVVPPLKSIDLIPLCIHNDHVNLRKLTISPLDPGQRHDFGIMIIRGILRNHRSTLEELNLSNCPINGSVFKLPMPKLRVLTAINTNISTISSFKHLVPSLQQSDFYSIQDSPRENLGKLLGTAVKMPSLHSFETHLLNRLAQVLRPCTMEKGRGKTKKSVLKQFDACSLFDFVSLVLFAMSFLALFVFGLSSLFRSYSPLIFAVCVCSIFMWEIYDSLSTSKA